MQNPPLDTETFIRHLLDQSDRQFCEISRLKAELKGQEEAGDMKSSYEKTILEQQETILSLESQPRIPQTPYLGEIQ